jgi:signal transduction histidine kinase
MFGLSDRIQSGKSTIGRLLVGFMALGFVSLIVAGLAAAWVSGRNAEHTQQIAHTYQVEIAIGQLSLFNEQAETSRRGYLLTRDPAYLAVYRDVSARVPAALSLIRELTRDNPRQQGNVATLRRLVTALAGQRDASISLVGSGKVAAAIARFDAETGARRMRGARDQAAAMVAEERRLLATRGNAQQASVRTFYTVLVAAGVLLLSVALVSLATILRYTRDLATSRDRLEHLNDTLEDQVAERTHDLSRANEEIQRFAYIVSHDLRSPLVNVMGFTAELSAATGPLAELVDRAEAEAPGILTEEAKLAAREDLPESIRFIRTSTQKMDRLINAILKLSREGRRTVIPEPLDIAGITDTAVAAMQQVVDARGVTITVERPMPRLVSDRFSVEQILSNLIENATKYLYPGRPGEVRVLASEARGRVIIAVADNGRGIDQRDHQRIFDLFRRSGRQDQPGEGIGLAHVRALAYRLGGTIDVRSTLGEGATFTLNLPAAFQTLQDASA